MLALEVIVEFVCCSCGQDVVVTLRCEGEGLADRLDLPASVKIPCPTCSDNNVIFFTPRGTLLRVAAEEIRMKVPMPSCN